MPWNCLATVVQSLSPVRLLATPWTAAHQASLSFTISQSLLKFRSIVIQPSHPLSSPSSPAFTLSKHLGLFLWVSSSHQVAKVLELQLQNQSSNEYLGLISFQIDWLISLQSKGLSRVFSNTTAQKHQFFNIQPSLWSNSHIHTRLLEKSLTLTLWTFVNKIMSLLFNMLSSFVRTFLSRNKCFLISCQHLQ